MANDDCSEKYPLTDEDFRSALADLKTYVDITEEDLRRIYELALRHARERLAGGMPVREIMTTQVVAVKKGMDIRDAAHLLSQHHISGMPVVTEEGVVVGVLSEDDILSLAGIKRTSSFRDVLRHLLGEPVTGKAQGGSVGEAMSSPAITITPDRDIREAAEMLHSRRIKRLPVVDQNNRMIGIITRADIVRALGKL